MRVETQTRSEKRNAGTVPPPPTSPFSHVRDDDTPSVVCPTTRGVVDLGSLAFAHRHLAFPKATLARELTCAQGSCQTAAWLDSLSMEIEFSTRTERQTERTRRERRQSRRIFFPKMSPIDRLDLNDVSFNKNNGKPSGSLSTNKSSRRRSHRLSGRLRNVVGLGRRGLDTGRQDDEDEMLNLHDQHSVVQQEGPCTPHFRDTKKPPSSESEEKMVKATMIHLLSTRKVETGC